MTQFNGNRALLQAFLADAEGYLEDYMGALAPSGEARSEASPDAALEALRGIRIGAEFLEIAPLAALCRQQEQSFAAALPGVPEEGVREALVRAGKAIAAQLAALAGRRGSLAQAAEQGVAATGPAEQEPAMPEIAAELASAAVAGPAGAIGDGEAAVGADAAADEPAQGAATAPERSPGAGGQAAAMALPAEGQAQAAPVTEMFQEWLHEWRAFREQIEHLYLGSRPGGAAQLGGADEEMQQEVGTADKSGMPGGEVSVAVAPASGSRGAGPEAESMAVLKLSIGSIFFALPAANVLGFVEPTRDVAPLSGGKALAAVNGSAVPVLDMRERWNLGERPADARIVLVESAHARIGLWADRVHGTESLRIQPLLPAAFYPAELRGAALSAQDEVVLLLRPEGLAGLEGDA